MITKNNPNAYIELFEKANAALNYTNPDDKITNLDDYFTCIEELKDYENAHPEEEPIFMILPADEGTFDIDANTRKITVPSAFSSGVGVKGDEIAEIVYFTIDRYFDTTDLRDKEILIQWKNADGDEGLSATINKTLAYKSGKVTFGWPIGSEITKAAGNVQFAVRFYDISTDENNKPCLNYSFSTLTSTIKINPSLDFEIVDEDVLGAIIDKNQLIYNMLRNSERTNVSGTPAAIPVFEVQPDETVDLDEDGRYILMAKAAVPASVTSGAGTSEIEYLWLYINKAGEEKYSTGVDVYIESEDTSKSDNDFYYVYSEDTGTYEHYTGVIPPASGTTVYEKYSTYEATGAGTYSVTATNRAGRGRTAKAESNKCVVPVAATPTFTYPVKNNVIMEGTTNITIETAVADNGTVTTEWLKGDTADFTTAETISDTANKDTIGVTDEGYYFLQATNSKNNDETSAHSIYIRVTNPVEAPKISSYLLDGGKLDVDPVSGAQIAMDGVKSKVIQVVVDESVPHDAFTYQWYRKVGDSLTVLDGETSSSYEIPYNAIGRNYVVIVTNERNAHTNTY
jgi:hypothetical protein